MNNEKKKKTGKQSQYKSECSKFTPGKYKKEERQRKNGNTWRIV